MYDISFAIVVEKRSTKGSLCLLYLSSVERSYSVVKFTGKLELVVFTI